MRKCLVPLEVVVILLLAASSLAQTARPQAPPRDALPVKNSGTAAISGRVIAADTRRPLRRARISIRTSESGGQPRMANTDSDGRYEVVDLPPGRYRISVTRSGYLPLQYGQRRVLEQGQPLDLVERQVMKDVDFVMPRMSVITGRVLDDLGDPIEGVTMMAMRLRYWEGRRQLVPTGGGVVRSDDAGQYRILGLAPGTYYVQATTRETWTVTEGRTQRTMGYAPTFFPGTTTLADAGRVVVGLGQEVNGVDVPLIAGRSAAISGTAFDSTGRPFSSVTLRDDIRGEDFASFRSAGSATVAANGTFVIRDVPAGSYKLVATTGRDTERAEAAILPIVVDSLDITEVALLGSQGGSVTGRILTDTGAVPAIPTLRVTLAAPQSGQPDPALLGTFNTPGSSDVAADGTFSIKGVFGRSRFRVTLPDSWMVKSIFHEGRDITDVPIELNSGERLSVDIVVTDRISTVSGQLSDEKGLPVVGATVLVFAQDAAQWGNDSSTIRALRPDRRGRYQVKGLPAGEYLAIALEYVEDGLWNDPEFLESLRSQAKEVTVLDGAAHDVALKLLAPDPPK